ncbi:MAG: type II toxin-antitoxin system VapC family toxin [Desulfobacteraceae bacterium]|nr:type II toxin-antitoxin system VapC family toxin [Desulfobacteraceae bacterium]
MRQYYLDTSVLLVYTLAGGSEPERYTAVRKLFSMIEEGRLKAVTSFYALHEMYLFALENAPDFDIGAEYGKEAVSLVLNTKVQVTPLLTRIERKINERFFRHLPDMSDMPHAVSAKIWGCDGIVAYDEHFRAVSDVIEYKTPEDITGESDITC